MWPYWVLFFLPASQALFKRRQVVPISAGGKWINLWFIAYVILILVIGLRHEVGGDWGNYVENIAATEDLSLFEVLNGAQEPGDVIVNWVASHSGLGVYLVNFLYAIFFTSGLLTFCRRQPRPWLALTVAVPYLITVVAMGYTRQGLAIGIAMLGLAALEDKRIFKFLLWIALAATFHKSAVILVPLAALAGAKNTFITLFWVVLTGVVLFSLLLQETIVILFENYIVAEYESSGAAIRIAMNALPALIFLLHRKRFQLTAAQFTFWTWMSLGALVFVVLLYASPSSTAVDRLALYWIPLQLFVLSRLPDAIGRNNGVALVWVFGVVTYSGAVHLVWLFFATHASSWIPYKFYPWVIIWR
jgi:hypothetical protein